MSFPSITALRCGISILFLSRITFALHSPHGNSPSIEASFSQFVFRSESPEASDQNDPQENEDRNEAESTVVSSSLLYDAGCLVSSQAIMCHGGDIYPPYNVDLDDDESEDDEDEDEEDNDDDGHSSMLSNASLRRTRVGASGSDTSSSYTKDCSDAPVYHSTYLAQSALFLRGGGAASDLGSEFAKKLLVAAVVTLVFEACCGHILEFLKIVMQTSPAGTSYAQVIRTITAEKGIAGMWDGFCPWGIVQAVFKGGVFGLAHAVASSVLVPLADSEKIPMQLAMTLAGGIAGGFQGLVLSPTLLLKTRVMTNPVFREKMSLVRTTWLSFRIGFDVVAAEGLAALMKGSGVFSTKRVFDWATRYFFSDLFEALLKQKKNVASLSAQDKIIASLLGGFFSTVLTLPLDVLVAKSQDAKKAGVKVSAWKLFREELHEGGWGGLYDSYMRGFEARLAHVCLTTVVIKTGSPVVYDALFGNSKVVESGTA